MPDLISHALVSRIILLGRWKKYLLLFIVGTILPDVLSRVPYSFLSACYTCSWSIAILHSPLPLTLFILLLTLLFRKQRMRVFMSLFLGMVFHLFLDSFQRHMNGGYYWLFPFSFRTWELKLFWPETTLYFIPPLIFLSLLVYSLELYFRARRVRSNHEQT